MQKTKVLALSGLALCTLILAGCGQTNTPAASSAAVSSTASSAASSAADVAATTLSVTGYPTVSVEGDVIDFSQYVTVAPENVSWSLSSENTNVVIDGHKVTFTDPGNWEVKITAGSNKKARKASGLVVSSEVKAIRDFVSAGGYNFTSTWGTAAKPESLNKIIRTDNYYLEYPKAATDADGYIALKDGNVYQCTYSAAGVLDVKQGIFSSAADFHYYLFAGQLPITATEIKDEVDSDNIPTGRVVIEAGEADKYGYNNVAYIAIGLGYSQYVDSGSTAYSKVTKFVLSLDENGKNLTVVPYVGDTAVSAQYVVNAIGSSNIAALDTYSKSGDVPLPATIDGIKTPIDAAVSAKSSYKVTALATWYSVESGSFKQVSDTTATVYTASDGTKYSLDSFGATAYVTGTVGSVTASFVDQMGAGNSVNYQKKSTETNGKFYKVTQDYTTDSSSKVTLGDTYKAEATTIDDIWSATSAKGITIGGITPAITTAARFSDKGSGDNNGTAYTYYSIDNAADSAAMAKAVDNSFPLTASPMYTTLGNVFESADEGMEGATLDIYLFGTDELYVSFYHAVKFSATATYYYREILDLETIGTATAPTAIDEAKITWPTNA